MKNPYDILGVSESSSDDEINKAYKSLARKYHPDINASSEAADKMVEINCAYDEIKKMREKGISFSSYEQSDSSTYAGQYYSNDIYFQVEQLIKTNRYFEAFIILQSVSSRDGKWYYYSAVLTANMGSLEMAKQYILNALNYEPNNQDYLLLKEKLFAMKQERRVSHRNPILSFYKMIFWMVLILSIVSCVGRVIGG